MKTLLKNGTLIDYKTNTFEKYDILIENDKIKEIAKNISISPILRDSISESESFGKNCGIDAVLVYPFTGVQSYGNLC